MAWQRIYIHDHDEAVLGVVVIVVIVFGDSNVGVESTIDAKTRCG